MAQYISVKRKQQTNKHAPLAIMLCLLFLLSSFSFSFADDVEFPALTLQPTNSVDYAYEYSTNSDASYKYKIVIYGTTTDDYSMSMFAVSGTDSGVYIVCDSTFSGVKYLRYTNNSSVGSVQNLNFVQKEAYPDIYYHTVNGATYNSSHVYNIPVFETLEDGLSAFSDFLSSSSGSFWSGSATVSVEAGCVAYILVDGGTATLTTTFPELSKLSRPLWTSGSTYSFENDLPSSGKVFSSTSGTLIDWLIPASAKTDLLGRSYLGGRPLSDLPSGQFLVVYNPVYRGYDDKGVGIMSPTIYVSLSNYGAVRQFRLTASYNGGLIESSSDDGYSSWFDSIGEEELDANGNPIYIEHLANGTTQTAISIPAGGGNIVINGDNADNSIGGLLDRLLSLLTAPIKYIERLYNSAIQFFDYLSSLWGWLPVEVTSIIGAALAVLVVIGVVKFLWK